MDKESKRRYLSIADIKKIAVEMLEYIDCICKNNDIQYYLAYGSVLGAVRHNGIIPWDDDIDIMMTRQNYEKFSTVMQKSKHQYYKLLYLDNKDYTLPLPKVVDTRTTWIQTNQRVGMDLGVYIDVFILDGVPEKEYARRKMISRLDNAQRLWTLSQFSMEYHNPIKKVIYGILQNLNPRIFAIRLDRISKSLYSKRIKSYGILTYTVYGREKDIIEKSILGSPRMQLFERNYYPIPEKYDTYLRNLYGDYHELPPEEKRVSNHTYVAYWKETD